ncbi:GNAT family N-acetyltransferase [Actinotalea sp. M2MS4P-6]|uniref:GNAT family N-acetyltransferase n=1 Tax=Actinotalea sp. M2MS4P-6 TaxID=2983762 RepID=UPI0021E3FAC7|nr:GNAT family protein [Actinotalea sp. M2MS4P-6]MCV2393604.1 GNAT family N-acetyltransferase [Actinotalea sp. M2MS4P-6]
MIEQSAGGRRHPAATALPLVGRQVRLEPLTERHAADLWRAFADADPSLWDYLGYGPFADEGDLRAWIAGATRTTDPFLFACIDAVTGRALGWAAILRVVPEHGVAEIGHLAYSPAMQRTPMSTEVAYLLLSAIFSAGYRRAEWKCDAANARSRRAATRLGFTEEGTFRQHMIVKGRNRDTCWFSLLDSEWPAARAALEAWLAPENVSATGVQVRSLDQIRAAGTGGSPIGPGR